MTQNDSNFPIDGTDASRQTTGAAGFASPATGTVHTDTVRPTAATATVPIGSVEAQGFEQGRSNYEQGRSSYQSSPREVTVSERTRPSRSVLIGSAVAGAIAGGAIPFMLAGRKNRETQDMSVQREPRETASQADDMFAADRSPPKYPR